MPDDTVAELRKLWEAKQPFVMQMEVSSPYHGCLYEPNIFLVTPIGCDLQETLMADVPTRYPIMRESWQKMKEEVLSSIDHLLWQVDYNIEQSSDVSSLYEMFRTIANLEECKTSLETIAAKAELVLLSEADALAIPALSQPPLCVWPLYASGQGVAMDAVHSPEELLEVCRIESIAGLAQRPRWPEALLGSRNLGERCSKTYGRIALVEVSALKDADGDTDNDLALNDILPAGERYWMHALQVAQEQWDVQLHWSCSKCNSVIPYDEYDEGRPEATGYSGDGGIGVHLHDVLCCQCLRDGTCEVCDCAGSSPMESYDTDIAEHGWNMCEHCTEALLDGALAGSFDTLSTA